MNSTERAFSEKLLRKVSKDERVVVAFSGGCDSLALLSLCVLALGPERVFPVYVNHRLREASELEGEIALNRENCRLLGVDLTIKTLEEGQVERLSDERGGGIEDAARILRYQALEEERQRTLSSYILTAHHRQDQLETIVMRLAKGSPVASLRGIAAVDERRHLLRPLLAFNREELEVYLTEKNLRWSTDSTNASAYFARNNIRNEVIPRIKAIWPTFDETLIKLGEQACELFDDGLEGLGPEVELSLLSGLNALGRTQVLFSMWDSLYHEKELPLSLVERVLSAVERGDDCNVGSNGAVFSLYRGRLYLTDPSEDGRFRLFSAELDPHVNGSTELLDGQLLLVGEDYDPSEFSIDGNLALRIDPDRFKGKVVIRYVREGDRIRLKGGAKMVLRLLQDMNIPSVLRGRVPVLEDEDGICAVFGSIYGGRDRICVKFISSLARNQFPLYIVSKG